jgi:hypothetical protein
VSGASLTGFAITDVATISTGVKAYSASACFFQAASIARISAPLRWTLSRSEAISCGVSRFDAVDGSAVGFGCFGMGNSIAERTAKHQSVTLRQGKR